MLQSLRPISAPAAERRSGAIRQDLAHRTGAAASGGRPAAAPVLAQMYALLLDAQPQEEGSRRRALLRLAAALHGRTPASSGALPRQPAALAPIAPVAAAGESGEGPVRYPLVLSLWRSHADLLAHVHESGDEVRRWVAETGLRPVPERVLWWVPAGHVPGLAEGLERAALLRRIGPGPAAFTLRSAVPPC